MEPLEVANPAQLSGTTVLTAAVNYVDLAIPADYRLLRLWWSARIDNAVAATTVTMTFNGDGGSNYGDQRAEANGAALAAVQASSATGLFVGTALGSLATARSPGIGRVEIPNYSGSTMFKAVTGHNFEDRGGTGLRIRPLGGIWRSTAPIRSVRLRAVGGALFSVGSSFGWEVVDPFSGSPWGLSQPNLTGAAPSGPIADLFRGILQQSDKYTVGTWYATKYKPQGGPYLDFGGMTEHYIRPAAAAAFGLAVSLSTGVYDPAVTGISEADARGACLKLVRSLAYRHRSNSPGGWGRQWQSNLWAALAAQAAWLVADGLTAGQKSLVATMIVDEADWRLSQPIPYWKNRNGTELTPGDSKAEESSWNAMLLQAAVVMLPEHPHRGAWLLRCRKLMISAFSRREDLSSNQTVDGIAVSRFLAGWNINSDGTVVNHNRIHPDYMCTTAHNLQAVCLFALAGYAPPQSAFHNVDLVYTALASRRFPSPPYNAPGGTIYIPTSSNLYYPQGNDWGTGRRMQAATVDAMMSAFGRAPGASDWARLHGTAVARMQARSTTGQTYIAAGEDTYPGREQWIAMHAGWAWLSLWVVSAGKYVPPTV